MPRRKGNERGPMTVKKRIVHRYQHANVFAFCGHKYSFQFALVRNIQKLYFSSECSSGTLVFPCLLRTLARAVARQIQ